jgi:hypothetical protein
MAGQFAYTLDCVDIATGWSEQRAVWGRGETGVLEQIRDIEKSLPFELLGFDCDKGSEFLNHHLLRHFRSRPKPVNFTRSRAYRKEDNAHVEQKNWTHVRQWIGYDRLDQPQHVEWLNALYCSEWRLFHNFFCPSVKLIQKQQIGSKTIKHHDSPQTPCQRLIDSPHIPQKTKDRLSSQLQTLTPFLLRKTIETKLKKSSNPDINHPSRVNDPSSAFGNINCEATGTAACGGVSERITNSPHSLRRRFPAACCRELQTRSG